VADFITVIVIVFLYAIGFGYSRALVLNHSSEWEYDHNGDAYRSFRSAKRESDIQFSAFWAGALWPIFLPFGAAWYVFDSRKPRKVKRTERRKKEEIAKRKLDQLLKE
jgi:hypothetical protein